MTKGEIWIAQLPTLNGHKKKLIDRALILYLESIRQQSDLYNEFDAWENLSDEALLKFEKSLQHDKGLNLDCAAAHTKRTRARRCPPGNSAFRCNCLTHINRSVYFQYSSIAFSAYSGN